MVCRHLDRTRMQGGRTPAADNEVMGRAACRLSPLLLLLQNKIDCLDDGLSRVRLAVHDDAAIGLDKAESPLFIASTAGPFLTKIDFRKRSRGGPWPPLFREQELNLRPDLPGMRPDAKVQVVLNWQADHACNWILRGLGQVTSTLSASQRANVEAAENAGGAEKQSSPHRRPSGC